MAKVMEPLKKILVVDDDPELRQLLTTYLNKHGYNTTMAANAVDLEAQIMRFSPDLVVLDRMMPGREGMAACRALREQGEDVPVILLTAKDEPVDRIMGLESGADDYVGKPFDPRELLARIEAVLRRKAGPSALKPQGPYHFGPFVFDADARQLSREGELIKLTGGEIDLLGVLIHHAGKPLSRERLLMLTRDDVGERTDRTIDIAVSRLRRLIEDDLKTPRWVQTVWGVGYRFVP